MVPLAAGNTLRLAAGSLSICWLAVGRRAAVREEAVADAGGCGGHAWPARHGLQLGLHASDQVMQHGQVPGVGAPERVAEFLAGADALAVRVEVRYERKLLRRQRRHERAPRPARPRRSGRPGAAGPARPAGGLPIGSAGGALGPAGPRRPPGARPALGRGRPVDRFGDGLVEPQGAAFGQRGDGGGRPSARRAGATSRSR